MACKPVPELEGTVFHPAISTPKGGVSRVLRAWNITDECPGLGIHTVAIVRYGRDRYYHGIVQLHLQRIVNGKVDSSQFQYWYFKALRKRNYRHLKGLIELNKRLEFPQCQS